MDFNHNHETFVYVLDFSFVFAKNKKTKKYFCQDPSFVFAKNKKTKKYFCQDLIIDHNQ
jgi:hypothetical protein